MSQIHAELPNEPFSVPSGIITATVCSKSGKLPIPGLCDTQGTLATEYFADGTVPAESCDVHYQGAICQYNGMPACELCPFKIEGVLTLTPVEDVSLQSGSSTTTQVVNPDGSVSTVPVPANQANSCPHNADFFATPGWEAIQEQQRNEIIQRDILAQQQAALEAQQQQQAAEQQPPAQ